MEWGGKGRNGGEKENGRDLGWDCCDLKGVLGWNRIIRDMNENIQ